MTTTPPTTTVVSTTTTIETICNPRIYPKTITLQIYSTAEPGGSSGGAFVSVMNSTFEGNIAANRGGAIASWGHGEVELSNCSFVGNEAVGKGDDRRAGSGGAVYASPGVFVTVRKKESRRVCIKLYMFFCFVRA